MRSRDYRWSVSIRRVSRSPFRSPRSFRLAGPVERDRLANERLEGGCVNFLSLVDVDRPAHSAVETRVEETDRILQRRAPGEGKLHDFRVGFAGADDAVVRPDGSAHPLPLFDDVRVCFLDELAHPAQGLPSPVPKFGDPVRDERGCRTALARAGTFHVLILESDSEDALVMVIGIVGRARLISSASDPGRRSG